MKNEEIIFKIILHSGDARSYTMESFKQLRENQYQEALVLIKKASECLNLAHQYQNDLICQDINGDKVESSLLMMHAQDHFMTSMLMRDMAKEIILLFESHNKGEVKC